GGARGGRGRLQRARRPGPGDAAGAADRPLPVRTAGVVGAGSAAAGDPRRRPVLGPGGRTRLPAGGEARRHRRVAAGRSGARGHRRPGRRPGARTAAPAAPAALRRPRGRRRRSAHHRRTGRTGPSAQPGKRPDPHPGGFAMSQAPPRTSQLSDTIAGGVGESPRRPDGPSKVRGEFAYASDLWAEDMLWGATLRSPHPHARIESIDITDALRLAGVHVVLTAEDVPGLNRYGVKHADQPVLAEDVVRYVGEPIALVAADHPETARRALERIRVEFEELDPVLDAERAAHDPSLPKLHPDGNVVRHQTIVKGDPRAEADVVVSGVYTIGMQDQAFLGPEAGLAIPAEDGGVDLYLATQDLHSDLQQIAKSLDLPPEKVRMALSGVGGAFGGREDLSMQVHVCLLALRTGKPVKMVYSRQESFHGHVHRHPAKLYYEHGATRDGKLVYVKARQYFDGGAYASKTPVVVGNGSTLGVGPYRVP